MTDTTPPATGGAERITVTTPEQVIEAALEAESARSDSLDLDAIVSAEDADDLPDSSTEESGDDDPDRGRKPPKGVQKRLDELTREKYEERRRADQLQQQLERTLAILERQQGIPEPQQERRQAVDSSMPPDPGQYPDGELDLNFIRDFTRFQVRQELESAQQAAIQERQVGEIKGREDQARAKYQDYDEVVNPRNLAPLASNPELFRTIASHESGPELAYFLGRNPEEVLSLAQMSPYQAAMKIGQLLSVITPGAATSKPAPSRAPAPITPIRGSGAAPAVSLAQAAQDAVEAGDYDRWRAIKRARESGKR